MAYGRAWPTPLAFAHFLIMRTGILPVMLAAKPCFFPDVLLILPPAPHFVSVVTFRNCPVMAHFRLTVNFLVRQEQPDTEGILSVLFVDNHDNRFFEALV